MNRHQNYINRAMQSEDPRYAQLLTTLGYDLRPAVEPAPHAPTTTKHTIPADWQDLHWSKQVKIAEEIAGDAFDAADGDTKAAKAKFIIEEELERQAANGA